MGWIASCDEARCIQCAGNTCSNGKDERGNREKRENQIELKTAPCPGYLQRENDEKKLVDKQINKWAAGKLQEST